MAHDCHSIPADCAKVALDEGEGTGNLLCFISRFFGCLIFAVMPGRRTHK